MLCTRMHLTERRYRLVPSNAVTDHRSWVRPCTTRNLLNGCFTQRTTQHGNNLLDPHPKTPLIIITLNIPPDIETLAPKTIKREPKKLPRIYKQCTSITKSIELIDVMNIANEAKKYVNTPKLLIQGYEITDRKLDHINPDGDDDSKELNSLSSCEYVMAEMFKNINQNNSRLVFNLNGYEMDKYGHLPGDYGTPKQMPFRHFNFRRTPSPNTGQIIRVNVTMNSQNSIAK